MELANRPVDRAVSDRGFRKRKAYYIAPDGKPIALADLPARSTRRWEARRKMKVVMAVEQGLISLEEACRRYRLTLDRYLCWQRSLERHELRMQVHRDRD